MKEIVTQLRFIAADLKRILTYVDSDRVKAMYSKACAKEKENFDSSTRELRLRYLQILFKINWNDKNSETPVYYIKNY